MGTIKIKSQTQPIENAEVFDIYSDSKKIAVCIVANEGFELIKEDEKPANISRVDIPVMYEERVILYNAIPWVEMLDEPKTILNEFNND